MANVGSQVELMANQNTTISMWTILVDRSTDLSANSIVTDELGQKYRIEGAVALRPKHRPSFKAAAARLISDMQ